MKTVERKECKTVLENVCSVTFVTECGDKASNEIDSYGGSSYGAPKAPLLRSKRQVGDVFVMGAGKGLHSGDKMERKYLIQVDSYGAPAAPLVEPCSCSPCQPSDQQCNACDAAHCEEEKYECLPGGRCPGCALVRETYMKNGQKYLIAKGFTKITAMYNQAISANVAKKLNFQRRSVER